MSRKKKILIASCVSVLVAGLAVGLIVPGIVTALRATAQTSVRYEAEDAENRDCLLYTSCFKQ